jgi:fructokinase
VKSNRLTLSNRVVAVGEILWDVFQDSMRLGGAPLNFAAHAIRLGHDVVLVSAVGEDELGRSALQHIEMLGLSTRLIQQRAEFPTGVAEVSLRPHGQTAFQIHRPAAYDAIGLSEPQMAWLSEWSPEWLYHGTLFAMTPAGANTLRELVRRTPTAVRFYDVNLRPESYRPELVRELLHGAGVVKLNEEEMVEVAEMACLPSADRECFCVEGTTRYGWRAVCVTLGARGCALLTGGQYAEEEGCRVEVADPVGAGDGFSAALLHGLALRWSAPRIARFANRVGALIASRPGGIPDWDLQEILSGVSEESGVLGTEPFA